MARRKRQGSGRGRDNESDINLTPMLDVVFILLIFFIVTAQFIKEPGVPILRPDVDNKASVKPLAILIAIDKNSDIYIDKQKVNPTEVGFMIREMRNDNPRGEVVVQTDVDAEAQVMVDVMEAINKIDGATVINISAKTGS
ncbi:MAG: ExbD/TolR family protein [Hyphomonas sp.]